MALAALTGSSRGSAKQASASFAAALSAGEGIRAILVQLINMRPTVQVEQRGILIAGDVALSTETWTICSTVSN